EGAQAFGWGLYFAENRDTAKFYADTLGGAPRKLSPEARKALERLDYLGFDSAAQAMSAIRQEPGDWKRTWDVSDATPEDIAAIEAQLATEGPKPTLYEVEIPDDAVARMLDWDAPLSEQPENVRAALEGFDSRILGLTGSQRFGGMPTGEDIYRRL